MKYSNILLGLEKLTSTSINEMHTDMYNFKLIETDTEEFLIQFCRKNIIDSLFIYQIVNYSEQAKNDFQEYIFHYVTEYLKLLINIDGLTFNYNQNEFPLIIQVLWSNLEICQIDIFNKKVEILEEIYFKEINDSIDSLNKKKIELEKEYEKFNKYSINPVEIIKDDNDLHLLQKTDIILAKYRKKNKYKIKNYNKCVEILNQISEIDLEINEYLLMEESLRKNMLSITYNQNKISDRLSNHLKYKIIKN